MQENCDFLNRRPLNTISACMLKVYTVYIFVYIFCWHFFTVTSVFRFKE